MYCSSLGKKTKRKKGFTLIELLISIGVLGILTAIVLVRHGAFESTTLLKSAAYDLALDLRDAQVRSVSASKAGGSFAVPFGISFDVTNDAAKKSYKIFADTNGDGDPDTVPFFDVLDDPTQEVTIDRTVQIHQLCITVDGGEQCSPVGIAAPGALVRVDISFKRPEYRSLIYAQNDLGEEITGVGPSGVTDATIYLSSSSNPSIRFKVAVTQLGQISVTAETP